MKMIMKVLGIIGVCLVLFSTVVLAETRYISDTMKITMRTEPGNDRKIISLLRIGQKVELLKPGDEWSLVRLGNGKEGWVISRFLTDETPSDIGLERLKIKHNALTTQSASLQEENSLLKEENNRFSTELAATKRQLQDLSSAHETLKTEASEFLELKSKYKKSVLELAEQTKKAEQFEEELNKLFWSQNIKWFLSGAGVLIFGFLIGFSTKRQRRRSSLL